MYKYSVIHNKYIGWPFFHQNRIYWIDLLIISYILKEPETYGYSATLALLIKSRSRRTIVRHLTKLCNLNILQRHGNTRCCYTNYTVNPNADLEVRRFVKTLNDELKSKSGFRQHYILLEPENSIHVQVPTRHVSVRSKTSNFIFLEAPEHKDPARPNGYSIRYENEEKRMRRARHLIKKLHAICKEIKCGCGLPVCLLKCNPLTDKAIMVNCLKNPLFASVTPLADYLDYWFIPLSFPPPKRVHVPKIYRKKPPPSYNRFYHFSWEDNDWVTVYNDWVTVYNDWVTVYNDNNNIY